MRPRHVVWDWNGTLLDDLAATVSAVNAALARLSRPVIDATGYRTHFVRPVRLFYQRLLGRPVGDDEWAQIDEAFHDAYAGLLAGVALATDAEATLRRVGALGLGQSLLSMWRHHELVPLVRRLGIAELFLRVDGLRVDGPAGVGGGEKAEHLRRHLRALHLPGRATVVIGDALDDLSAARAVGASCVLLDGGCHHRAALDAAGAPVAASLGEALDLALTAAGRPAT